MKSNLESVVRKWAYRIAECAHFRYSSRSPVHDDKALFGDRDSRATAAFQPFVRYVPLKFQVPVQNLKKAKNLIIISKHRLSLQIKLC